MITKHWFVEWLEEIISEEYKRVAYLRRIPEGKTPGELELFEAYLEDGGMEELLADIEESEQDAALYTEWVQLTEDMIKYGLEEGAIQYYEGRSALRREKLLFLPTLQNFTHSGIWETVEEMLKNATSSEEVEHLTAISVTLGALFSSGQIDEANTYYMKKRKQHPELKLPEPKIYGEGLVLPGMARE